MAYVRTGIDRRRDAYRSSISLVDRASRRDRILARGHLPRFSPLGGAVAFARDHQLWWADPDPSVLVSLPGTVRDLTFDPEGGRIACVVGVAEPPVAMGVHRIRRSQYKLDGHGLTYDVRPQIFLVNWRQRSMEALTELPFGATSPTWCPSGRRIAYIACDEDPDRSWVRLIVVRDLDSGEEHIVFRGTAIQDLAWSPTADLIAFRAGLHPYLPSMNLDLFVAEPGGQARVLTEALDRFVGNDRIIGDVYFGFSDKTQRPQWRPSGDRLLFLAASSGRNRVYEVAAEGGIVEELPLPPRAGAFDFSVATRSGEVACVLSTESSPTEIWLLPAGERLTALNTRLMAARSLATPEHFTWHTEERTGQEGWLFRPPESSGRDAPLVLYVHGGPYRLHSPGFFHEVQSLAGRGYLVFCPNPRGSQGYGEAFASAIDRDWGHKDYDDLMASLDQLLQYLKATGVRPRGLGVLGGSYGGYMVNWIVTHTARFGAAVSDRGISNLLSYLGTADCAVSFGRYAFGRPWDDGAAEVLLRQSPITYAAHAVTPTLLLQPVEDQVCPLEQGEQFYHALLDYGCETELVLFPGCGHELPRSGPPSLRLRRLQLIAEWFDRHLAAGTPSHVE